MKHAVLTSVAAALGDYQPLRAVQAELFSRKSLWPAARAAYAEAIARAPSAADALFLHKRLGSLPH